MGSINGAMRNSRLACFLAAATLAGGASLRAAEPHMEFLRGLRSRGYHDFALLYLEQLESRDLLPAAVREELPYEKASTLIENAKTARDLDTQQKQLDEAQALLEKFVAAHPAHPKAASASFERARILFERGRAAARAAASEPPSTKADTQRRAREHFAQSRTLFQQMHDRLQPEVEKNKGHIDADDKIRAAERTRVETDFLWSQLYLAQLSYEEALTYESRSSEFKDGMERANAEFAKIHEAYRNQPGGWHARLWQGKSFEQQGEIGKALGIFNELLAHPAQSDAIEKIRDQALQFRLACLNHPDQKDFRNVVDDATQWLNSHKADQSARALEIRWERARALDALGHDAALPEAERQRLLQQALADARDVSRGSGEHTDEARQVIQRAQVALGRQPADPRTFDEAFGLGQNMIDELSALNEQLVASADAAEQTRLKSDLDLRAREAARLLKLALSLADSQTEAQKVNQVRYMLAWVYYLSGEPYHAAILAEHTTRFYGPQDSQSAVHAAYLALSSWLKAYSAAPAGQRDVELAYAERVAEMMQAEWPDEERTGDARMDVGRVYAAENKPTEAARWYAQVPETSPVYSAAQLAAGQAFWTLYVQAASQSDEQKPTPEQLQEWQRSAEGYLRKGIEKAHSEGEDLPQPRADALVAGKVSLAQIAINTGRYEEAIELLTRGPHSVLDAIRASDESSRPATGITSRTFAALCYQLLLRAYVGTQQIDQALSAMEDLEKMAGGAGAESVTAVYVQLGREIQSEIERLVAQDRTERLAEVRASFDQFLNELFRRKDQMKYSSLIWIAETYYALGQGMEGEHPGEAAAYFKKAAETYRDILGRSDVPEGRGTAVRIRLVNCMRRQGDFDEALTRIGEVLDENPKLLDAQFEAAAVLQDWGTREPATNRDRLLEAINGRPVANVWGWREVAVRLQRMLESAQKRPEHDDKFYQARFNIADCRRSYALSAPDSSGRAQALNGAKQDLEAVAYLVAGVPERWQTKFDALYRRIQADLNVPPEQIAGINWSDSAKPQVAAALASNSGGTAAAAPGSTRSAADASAVPRQSRWPMIAAVFIVVLGLAGAGFYVVSQYNRHRRHARSAVRKVASATHHDTAAEHEFAEALAASATAAQKRNTSPKRRNPPPPAPKKTVDADPSP